MIPKNPKKWVVIYDYRDGMVYFSQAQYDAFLQAVKHGDSLAVIDDRPYRTSCITAELKRDVDRLSFREFHPEDKFDFLTKLTSSYSDWDRKANFENLKAKKVNGIWWEVAEFCIQYNLWDLWQNYFGKNTVAKKKFENAHKKKMNI